MDKTYEMFWDCEYCGSAKLLGKTHRFCPGCGAPQNPESRYFPDEDQKVAVEDHEYVGADRVCPACDSAMNAKAAHCTQCGSPMDGSAEVSHVTQTPAPTPQSGPDPAPQARKGGLGKWLLLGAVVLAIGAGLTALFWRTETQVTAVERSWQRVIHVETFAPVKESAWCDEMPPGAYGVARHRDVRSHRKVEDGQDCKTVRVDNADGTFREEQKCSPRYRQEAVYDERCDFTVDRWSRTRSETSSGTEPASSIFWPQLTLRTGSSRGSEREGGREEHYRVKFSSSDGNSFECELDEAKWRATERGSRWRVKVGALTGGASCSSLAAFTAEAPQN